jgi:hypothetical protein
MDCSVSSDLVKPSVQLISSHGSDGTRQCFVFFDYPLYMIMFPSKAHNINIVLRRTALREWIEFADMHHNY